MWIDALIDLWKKDEEVDFRKLETTYKLKPLEKRGVDPSIVTQQGEATRDSLLVCLTGFGDQRDEIASKITSNGGRYTGDLTRRCTHLIVNKPEGKKYQAAKAWGIYPVTLAWLDQSIARGMILDETKFDPTLSPEEQGLDAWNKKDPTRPAWGKRSKSAITGGVEDGPRKLRKTASMKLNSQTNNLWGDILGRSTSREYSFAREQPPTVDQDTSHQAQPQPKGPRLEPLAPLIPEDQGIFSNCYFFVYGFTEERTRILESTITTLGGIRQVSVQELAASYNSTEPRGRFLIVPQTSQPATHPKVLCDNVTFVTEYYIEKCLHNKQYFDPNEHVLGRPFPFFPIPAFENLVICSAAFTGIELNQVARAVAQLGAKFDGDFRKTTSVVVCLSLQSMRKEKLQMALKWGVPVVSAGWLWECISTGYKVPIDDYIFPEIKDRYNDVSKQDAKPAPEVKARLANKPIQRTRSEPVPRISNPLPKPPINADVDTTAFDHDSPEKTPLKTVSRPIMTESITSADFATAHTHPAPRDTALPGQDFDSPLTELSFARLNKFPSPAKHHTPMPRTLSDPTTKTHTTNRLVQEDPQTQSQEKYKLKDLQGLKLQFKQDQQVEQARKHAKAAERQALSSKLSSLIETATTKPTTNPHAHDESDPMPRPRRRQILGRAISNASNASSAADAASTRSAPESAADILHGSHGPDETIVEAEPPSTQLEYMDPRAQEFKAAIMNKMIGGSGVDVRVPLGGTQTVGAAATRTMRPR